MKIVVDQLPGNLEEMKKLEIFDLTAPENTAALAVLALAQYPGDPEASLQMLDALRGSRKLSEFDRQFLRDRFQSCPYVMRSYFKGATPGNNYAPDLPYELEFVENPHSRGQEGYLKLFIASSGADSLRYVVLRQKPSTGEWFLWEQYLAVSIRMPKDLDPWA